MIYKSLRELPYMVALDIMYTGDVRLLTDEPNPDVEELSALWAEMLEKFQRLFNDQGERRIFNVVKEIDFLIGKYETILSACVSLEFDASEPLIQMLRDYGYRLRPTHYQSDLKRIVREAEGIKIKINDLKKQLPEKSEKSEANYEQQAFEQMAGCSAILGINFDYNAVSVMQYHAIEQQVKTKIKHLQKSKK